MQKWQDAGAMGWQLAKWVTCKVPPPKFKIAKGIKGWFQGPKIWQDTFANLSGDLPRLKVVPWRHPLMLTTFAVGCRLLPWTRTNFLNWLLKYHHRKSKSYESVQLGNRNIELQFQIFICNSNRGVKCVAGWWFKPPSPCFDQLLVTIHIPQVTRWAPLPSNKWSELTPL